MKEFSFNKLILLLFLFILGQTSIAQVTIGTAEKPASGALLQLKDKVGVVNGEANATKGLLLPRVDLVAHNKLIIGSLALPKSEHSAHVGLTVYNANSFWDDQCLLMANGIYTWDGSKWTFLGNMEDLVTEVGRGYDQDDNDFYYRDFGSAGTWMITNMRAKKFDPLRNDGQRPIGVEIKGSLFENDMKNPAWSFPLLNNSLNFSDSTRYAQNRIQGLLYNWAGATNSKKGEDGKDPVPNEAGLEYGAYVTREQGICPFGWYLPSDKEWTDLENEVRSSPHKYSTIATIAGVPISTGVGDFGTANAVTWRGTTHGLALTSECSRPDGASLPWRKGGFSAFYVGNITASGTPEGDGKQAFFWTSSVANNPTVTDNVTSWSRTLINTQTEAGRSRVNDKQMMSVRCKKEDCISWNDQSATNLAARTVTDHEGNVYNIEEFGTAGWWMTQNMRAKTIPDPCYGPVAAELIANKPLSFSTPQWAYAKDVNFKTNLTGTAPSGWTQQDGMFYNWAATTYRKGGSDGKGNVEIPANPNGDYNEGNKPSQSQRRGICPKGWHVPSDYEYIELQKAMIADYNTYSTGVTLAPIPWNNAWIVSDPRENGTHAPVMKSTTPINGNPSAGKSNKYNATGKRGFDGLLLGLLYIPFETPVYRYYGLQGGFWTSSSSTSDRYGKGTGAWNIYMNNSSLVIASSPNTVRRKTFAR